MKPSLPQPLRTPMSGRRAGGCLVAQPIHSSGWMQSKYRLRLTQSGTSLARLCLLIVLLGLFGPDPARAQGFIQQTGAANPFNDISTNGFSGPPTLVDLDGDGDLDFITVDPNGNIAYYRNTGTRTAPVYTAVASPIGLPIEGVGYYLGFQFGDLDGDGDLDAITGNSDGAVLTYRNTGSRTSPAFSQLTGASNPFAAFQYPSEDYSYVSPADFGRDDDLDLLVMTGRGLHYLRNTGSPSVPAYTEITGSGNPFAGVVQTGAFLTPSAGDGDGDGDLDLTVSGNGAISYYQNIGTRTGPVFIQLTGLANPFSGFFLQNSLVAIGLGDVDDDGDADAVVGVTSRGYTGPFIYFKNVLRFPQPPTPTSQTVCAGGSVSTTVRATSDGTVSYQWYYRNAQNTTTPVTGQTTATLRLTNVQASDAGLYFAQATGGGGSLFTTAFTLTVDPLPTFTVTAPAAVCAGKSVDLSTTVSAASPAGGTFAYFTSAANAQVGTSPLASPVVSPGTSATYFIRYTTSAGCFTVGSVAVTVNPQPTAGLTNNGPLTCAQTSVTLTAGSNQPDVTYFFSRDGEALGQATANNTYAGNQPGVYTVQVSNANGCTGSASTTVASTTAMPAILSLSSNGPLTCARTSVTLTATSVGSGVSYRFGGPGVVSQSGNQAVVNAPGTYSLTVTSTTTGCFSTTTIIIGQDGNPPSVSIDPANASLTCANPVLTLTATSSGATLRWSTLATTPAISVTVAGTYSVTTTAPNGCTATASTTVTGNTTPPATPSLLTQTGQTYPGGQSSVTVDQNSSPVILVVSGCGGGTLTWDGGNATTLSVSTATLGRFTYAATCTLNGCTSAPASATVVVQALPATLSVSHQNADNNQPQNNTIKPYLQLNNEGTTPIAYGEITLRYWLTVEQFAPLTNLSVYYAQLGSDKVKLRYVELPQPRQGAFGYVEYRFEASAGNLAAGANSGPIQTGIGKQDWTPFNESDDYSYANTGSYTKNSRITAYRNGPGGAPTLIWGTEPAEAAPVQSLKVYTENRSGAATNTISTYLQLRNEGNGSVNYSDVKVRYYFTSEGSQSLNFYVDYAVLGSNNVKGTFVKPISPLANADTYLEFSFPNLTKLYPLSSTGNIQYRIAKNDWSNFSQANDHSYQNGSGPLAENNRVVVYVGGVRVYGSEPGAGARLAAESVEVPLSVTVLGNPVQGSAVDLEVQGAEGEPLRLQLTDLTGRSVSEGIVERAGAVEHQTLSLGSQPGGLLLLRVSTPGQTRTVRVLKTK